MHELKKGLAISLRGPQADEALLAFRRQMQQWGIALPTVSPLVLDFGLGNFAKFGLIEYWIANELEAGYCAKYLFTFDGQSCPAHHHRTKHETFFVVQGQADVVCDGHSIRLAPGDTLAIATGQKHGFTGRGPLLLLEVSQPCLVDDNYFENSAIPIGGNYRPAPRATATSADVA